MMITDASANMILIAVICLAAVAYLAEMRLGFLLCCAATVFFALPLAGIDSVGMLNDFIRNFR